MQSGPTATLLLLLMLCCNGQAVGMDASDRDKKVTASRSMLGLNQTCVEQYKLCQLGKQLEPQATAAGQEQQAGTGEVMEHEGGSEYDASSTPAFGDSTSTFPAEGLTLVAAARQLLADSGSTTPPTPSASTACAPIDPAAEALLKRRYRGFKVNLALSDFWELFYSLGNLWYAINDLLKQGLSVQQSGRLVISAESILLFNQNLAGITAWWGNLIQNLLLFSADALLPLPTDS